MALFHSIKTTRLKKIVRFLINVKKGEIKYELIVSCKYELIVEIGYNAATKSSSISYITSGH